MGITCGKCNLEDHISGMGGYYDSITKKPVKFGDEDCYGYTSDLLQDFEAFKKQTGGVIYQHREIKLQSWMRDEEFNFIKEHCSQFDYHCLKEAGKAVKISDYTFTYWNNNYSFKTLKKKGVWVEVPIMFNTLLDLLPYFPYIVTFRCGNHVVITNESYVDSERTKHVENCWDNTQSFTHYKKNLADLYLEVCKRYFLYDLENRTKIITITNDMTKDKDGNYIVAINKKLDYMHDIEFIFEGNSHYAYWTSPKITKDDSGEYHLITISKEDVEVYLKDDIKNNTVSLKYVEYPIKGFPLWI